MSYTRKALVTSGPTHEPIDPVRYIANRSSGKQGYAIAAALAELGAEVLLQRLHGAAAVRGGGQLAGDPEAVRDADVVAVGLRVFIGGEEAAVLLAGSALGPVLEKHGYKKALENEAGAVYSRRAHQPGP